MLIKILQDLKPEYLAVAFDLPAPTFRQQAYTAYQSRRPEMPVKLDGQITLTHEMLTALKVPFFEMGGFEADDCIGTLTTQAVSGEGSAISEVYIVTGDRDMLQLVNEQVRVYVPIRGLSETKTYDAKLIEEEFGVKPNQWVDVKALKGDASDNYPGVAGIGPKTACDLIARFGTLEGVYERLGEIGKENPKLAKKLAEGAEDAGLGKKLATIVRDVPGVKLDWEVARVDTFDWQKGMQFMRQSLGFTTIPNRIEKEILSNKENKEEDKTSAQMKLV